MKWPEDSDDRAKFFCITVTVIFVIIMTIFSIGVLSE
jgi:hypothetical protein